MVAKFRFSIFFLPIFLIIIVFSTRTESGCWKITDRQGNVTVAKDIWHFKGGDDKISYIKGWVNSAYVEIPIEKIHSIEIQKGWDYWHTIFNIEKKGWGVGIITLRSGTKASFASYFELSFISEFGEAHIRMSHLKSVTR